MRQALRLAELLCSRLCHDLGTPLGTLAAALELTGQNGAGPGVGMGAIAVADAAASAISGRVRLLRAAWAGEVAELGAAQIAELASALSAWRRVEVDVSELDRTTSFPPSAARLLLNLILLGSEGLPTGGTIVLSGSALHDVLVEISGPRAAWPAGLAAALADEQAAWNALERPTAMQLALTALLARSGGFRLSILMSGAPLEIPPPLLLTLAPHNRL
jgi:histidine phosphotransferase ChpT